MNRFNIGDFESVEVSARLLDRIDTEMSTMDVEDLWAAFFAGLKLGLEGYVRMGKALFYLSRLEEDLSKVPMPGAFMNTLLRIGSGAAIPKLMFDLRAMPRLQALIAQLSVVDQARLAKQPEIQCVVSENGRREVRLISVYNMRQPTLRQVFFQGRIRTAQEQHAYLNQLGQQTQLPMPSVRKTRGGFIINGSLVPFAVIEACYEQLHPVK